VGVPTSRRVRVAILLALLVASALLAATAEAVLTIWRERRPLVLGRPDMVSSLAFTPTGDLLLALEGADRPFEKPNARITAWIEPTGAPAGTVVKDAGSATDIAVSSRSDVLAVTHTCGTVTLHSLPRGESPGQPLQGTGWQIGSNDPTTTAVRFAWSGRRVAADGVNGSLSIWAVASGERLNPPKHRDGLVGDEELVWDCEDLLGFASEDEVVYGGSGCLRIWSISRRTLTAEIPTPGERRHFLSPRGTLWVGVRDDTRPFRASVPVRPDQPARVSIRLLPSGKDKGAPVAVETDDLLSFSEDDELVAVAGDRRVYSRKSRLAAASSPSISRRPRTRACGAWSSRPPKIGWLLPGGRRSSSSRSGGRTAELRTVSVARRR
jgi:hypothetical protein